MRSTLVSLVSCLSLFVCNILVMSSAKDRKKTIKSKSATASDLGQQEEQTMPEVDAINLKIQRIL